MGLNHNERIRLFILKFMSTLSVLLIVIGGILFFPTLDFLPMIGFCFLISGMFGMNTFMMLVMWEWHLHGN